MGFRGDLLQRAPGARGREALRRRVRVERRGRARIEQAGQREEREAVAVARETGLPVLEKPLSFERLRELVEQASGRRAAGSLR